MTLVLSVLFGQTNKMLNTKKMAFPFDGTVHDMLHTISEKMQEDTNMEDYALFLPKNKEYDYGQWMVPKRTIESYGLVTGDEVWFRKKNQIVAVLLPDGSIKKMMLDVCQTIKNLVATIAEKMSLHHSEAFGIQIQGKNQFLRMKSTLYEVAKPDEVITLKKRHFIQEGELNREDPMLLHLSYIQAHDNIVNGLYPCNKEEIIRFGSLNLMEILGKCNENHSIKTVHQHIKEIVPEMYQKKDIEKDIFAKWKGTPSMTPIDAKYKYLQLCMTLRSYGSNIYTGGIEPKGVIQSDDPKKKKLTPVLMAFSPIDIKLMTMEHKVLAQEPYEHLKSWKFSTESITFNFGKNNNGEVIVFFTKEGEDIFSLVQGYIEIITLKASKIEEDTSDLQKAEEVKIVQKKKIAAVKQTVNKTRIAPQMAEAIPIVEEQAKPDVYQANKTYALPVNFAVDVVNKAQSAFDNWRNQLRTQSDNLLGLLKPLSESFRGGAKLTDEDIKKIGFFVEGVRSAVINGQMGVEDKDIFEAMANNLMDAVNEYMDLCTLLEKDPTNKAYLQQLADCEARIQMCLEALNACADGLIMDLDQDVIFELCQTIALNIDSACEYAKNNSQADLEQAILDARGDARMMIYAAQSMGLALGSEQCQKLMKNLLSKCKNSSVNVLEKSQLKGTQIGEPLEIDMDDICRDLELMDNFIDDIKDDKLDKRKKFLEAAGGALQMVDWIATKEDLRIEDVQKTALEVKKDVPTIVKYMKEETSAPDIDDAKRAFIVGNLKEMTINTKTILSNADQNNYSPNNNDDIRESATLIGDAIRAVLGEDISEVIHNSMYTDSKKAAISALKLAQLMVKKARSEKNEEFREELLRAAREMKNLAGKLIDPVEEDDKFESKYIEKSLQACKEYEEFKVNHHDMMENVPDGKAEIAEERIQLDLMMEKMEQNINTFQKENMLQILRVAGMDYRMAAIELKREIITVDCANELQEEGLKEELNEEAIKELEAFSKVRHELEGIEKFDYTLGDKVEKVADQAKKSIRALVKASRTSKKKNERKLLLDAAMKLSNEMQRMLGAVDEDATGGNGNMRQIDLDLTAAEKQIFNILKLDDFDVDVKIEDVKITSEEIEAEKKALKRMEEVTEELKAMHAEMEREVKEQKQVAEESEDPKKIVEAHLQEAVVVMVGSSIGVLQTATNAQAELVLQLQNPETAAGVHRDIEYAEELVKAVEDVKTTAIELKDKINDDNVNSDELVKCADKVGKKVERVVVSCRAGTKAKGKSNKYRDLIDASKRLAEATKNLLECAKKVDEFDDTPVVVQLSLPPPPPPVVEIEEEEEDIETFGIDAYTLKEIEQQKKIFELEKKLEAAKKKKADLEELAKQFQD